MSSLGSAIPPLPPGVSQGLEKLVAGYLAEQGDSARLLKEILEGQQKVTELLVAAAADLASAARSFAQQTALPAPVVNVEVPVPSVTVEPQVNVTAEPHIEILPVERPAKTVTRVVRDSNELIAELHEECV